MTKIRKIGRAFAWTFLASIGVALVVRPIMISQCLNSLDDVRHDAHAGVADYDSACAKCAGAFERSTKAWKNPSVEPRADPKSDPWKLHATAEALWHGETQEALKRAKTNLEALDWLIWEMDFLRASNDEVRSAAVQLRDLRSYLERRKHEVHQQGKLCQDAYLAAARYDE